MDGKLRNMTAIYILCGTTYYCFIDKAEKS